MIPANWDKLCLHKCEKKGTLCVNSEMTVHLPGMVQYYGVGVLGIGCECSLFHLCFVWVEMANLSTEIYSESVENQIYRK